jgi:hypothetical protein
VTESFPVSPSEFNRLSQEVAELRELVLTLAGQRKRRRGAEEGYIPLAEAATYCGRTVQGLQCWLKRLANDPEAPVVRKLHGRVHRGDLQAAVEAKRKIGRGEVVRGMLEREFKR